MRSEKKENTPDGYPGRMTPVHFVLALLFIAILGSASYLLAKLII